MTKITLSMQIECLRALVTVGREHLPKSSRRGEADHILAGADRAIETLREIALDEQAHREIIAARKRASH